MRRGQSVLCGAFGIGLVGFLPWVAQAAPILVPNGSFESTAEGDVIATSGGGVMGDSMVEV